jgi:hypothetical protein
MGGRGGFLGQKATEASVESVVAKFGAKAKEKLANPGATGQPEDQLRAPFEQLLADFAMLCNLPAGAVTAVGESSQKDIKTRPDYSVTVHNAEGSSRNCFRWMGRQSSHVQVRS